MSMWDWEEQGESYPPDDRQQYRDPHASHSGSSDYHGAHQSYRDHSHHHHGHTGGNHDHQHHQHHQQDDAHSYHGHSQGSAGASPSHHNYGGRHESYEDPGAHQNYGARELPGEEEDRGLQSYGWRDANDDQGDAQNLYGSPTHTSNMAPATGRQAAHYRDNEGYDSSAGYEVGQEHHSPPPPTSGHGHETSNQTDLFTSDSVVNLTLDEIDALARTHRSRAWLVVLYAPWCHFCQAMEANFERVAQHLENSNVYVGKFRADGDYKEYAKRYLQLEHFPTVLFFPKDSSNVVKYHSENREVDALLGFVQAFE